jgi:prepilin-type N-terminal cleavage/methylation domain-containing protein
VPASAADPDAMSRRLLSALSNGARGFSLVEMIVVVFLLALAMIGLLSVFDASARINKSEQDVADAQGAVRYGIHTMTRAIRMAGSGGLFVTQAVLNGADQQLDALGGISVTNSVFTNSYDNVQLGTTVTSLDGTVFPVRPGTDMIEIRGVINSPLLGFDLATGCNSTATPCDPATGCLPCQDSKNVNVVATTLNNHVNNDNTQRIQFSAIDDYTATAATNPMLVLVAFNDDIHPGCGFTSGAQTLPLYPQTPYNVGAIGLATNLAGGQTFGVVNFADPVAKEFNPETPAEAGTPAIAEKNVRRAGILDDLVFFIDNTDKLHPALAQGTRRGMKFDVVTLADDVEDMQIAYGVDKNGNNAIDDNEWSPDGPLKTPYTAADFRSVANCPLLHGVMITLVAKSHDPDPTYKAPTSKGIPVMNSPTGPGNPREYPGFARYRRRLQTLRINLRNYAYEGS